MNSISIIIITQGRVELLMKCLSSLLQMPKDIELVLLSNGEALHEKARDFIEDNFGHFQIIESETQLSPGAARNLAITRCQNSEWLLFLDDDAYLEESYWKQASKFIAQKEIDVLGGPDIAPRDMSYFSRAVSVVLTSPFCTGLTFSRHYPLGKKLQFATEENLTSANLWVRKKWFESVQFPIQYKRGEESVVLARFSEMGLGMYYHPKLRVYHYRRSNLATIFKVNFKGGYYRSLMMREKIDFSWSYFLPSLFVLLHLSAYFDFNSFLELTKIYLLLIACISLGISQRQRRLSVAPLVFLLHYFIVMTYGLGFMWARIHVIFKKA